MYLRKIIFFSFLGIFSLFVFSYGVYKALPIILGPKIDLTEPRDGEEALGTTIPVRGTVYRTKMLLINSIPTPVTETGMFESKVAIYPGSNILILEAEDRFGRTTTITRNIGTKN